MNQSGKELDEVKSNVQYREDTVSERNYISRQIRKEQMLNSCIGEDDMISHGIDKLNNSDLKILFVLRKKRLVGVVTDGDIRRRYIVSKKKLDDPIASIMTKKPVYVRDYDISSAEIIMREKRIDIIPVVDDVDCLIGFIKSDDLLRRIDEIIEFPKLEIPVVIMAGGKGTRLRPLTDILPKPLIPIGGETVVEKIISSFSTYGFQQFIITINYKKNIIKSYFDTLELTSDVTFFEEEDYLGTCGCLSLLENLKNTFIVTNCDIILSINFRNLVKYHKQGQYSLTAVVCKKNVKIPYGVIDVDEERCIKRIIEKPQECYTINTGVYVMEPEALKAIPTNTFFQMNELIETLIRDGRRVGAYYIDEEEWSDMGQFTELGNMISTFAKQ